MADIFNFHEFQPNHFSFMNRAFGILSKKKKKKNHHKTQSNVDFILFSSRSLQLFLTLLTLLSILSYRMISNTDITLSFASCNQHNTEN